MTRREVLVGTAAATLTGVLASGSSAAPAGTYQHSLCGWCFQNRGPKWSLAKLCEVAVELKIPSIELVGAAEFPLLQKQGLKCAITSTGLGFAIGYNNTRHRAELITKTKAAIDATAAAKFPNVIGFVGMEWPNPTDPQSGRIPRDEAFKNCVEGIKEVAGYAEANNVNLCIEHLNSRDGSDPMTGHPGYQGDDLDWVLSILKAVGSPRVKLLFDVYHVQIMHGDLIRRLEQCKDFLGHIHTAGVPGRNELNDQQEIFYPAVMKKLAALKYAGFVGHEFLPTGDAVAGIQQAVAACTV
ncbi:MAG: TIM barrel protein [Gemmataceae bacterium]